ncbi:MAG: hypothetical protein OXH96_16800 [Spirochaetaceae bacterium]|nr:hypothetical protein [Spirochaetaceae bacterium]
MRYGVIRHGKLGWTAADLLAGNHHTPHRRRPDGVPLVRTHTPHAEHTGTPVGTQAW